VTPLLNPTEGNFNPQRLVRVNGRFVYFEEGETSLFGSNPGEQYEAALALRDLTRYLEKRLRLFGTLDVVSELRRVIEHPLSPSAEVFSLVSYHRAQLQVVRGLLDEVLA
jgi:hypothetical protein